MPEPLLAAIEQTQLQRPCEALALLLAAAWCEEHRGGKLPEQLIPIARKLARNEKIPNEAHAFLVALAVRTKDSGLLALTKNRLPGATPEKWRTVEEAAVKLADAFLATRREPALAYMHDKPSNLLAGRRHRAAGGGTGRAQ